MKTQMTSNEPFYIDKQIKKQLLKGQEAIRVAGQDRIYLITGKEGAGKSLLAIQLAYFVDNNLSLDDITMTADDFFDKVRSTTKKVVIGDEIFAGLSSKGALTKENKRLVKLLIECRQRGLTIFLCIPSIFLLEKYVAIFRSHDLFNVQISRRSYKNRFYKVYNYMNKKILFMAGHKYMSYSKPIIWKKHRFYGNFPPTIKKGDYEIKKARAFKEIKTVIEDLPHKFLVGKSIFSFILKNSYKMSFKKQSEASKDTIAYVDASTLAKHAQKYGKTRITHGASI